MGMSSRSRRRRSSPDNRASGGSGFTLLEVLAAVAILALAVVSLYSLQNKSIGLVGYINEMTIADMIAREEIAQQELKVRYPNLMIPKKSLQDEYPDFTIEDLTQGDTDLGLQLPETIKPKPLGVRVTWKHEGREYTLTLRSFLPVP